MARPDRKDPQRRVTLAEPPLPELPRRAGQPLRVAVVPFSDAYVDAVLPGDVVRVGPVGEPSPWLDSWHLSAHATDIDVLHLNGGYDHLCPAELEGWTDTVWRLGVPLVVTVHELPAEASLESARLAAVLAAAEVVFCLTPGAADEIAERFHRTAVVVACPALAAPDPDLGAERGLVGLRLGSSTSEGADVAELVRSALSGAVSGGGRLRVLVDHGGELDPDVADRAARGELDVVRCRPCTWPGELQQLHVAVLPERCGTHSRDLEVCRDVGTRVVAPRHGWFQQQWSDVVTYGTDDRGAPEGVSLAAAVSAALTRPMPRPVDPAWRRDQAEAVTRVHREVYAQLAGDRSRW